MPMPRTVQASTRPAPPDTKDKRHKSGREDEIRRGQHIAPAVSINRAAGERPEQAGEQQRGREDGEEPFARHVQIGRDPVGEHRRQIVGRAPGERLRDAEGGDDDAAPPMSPAQLMPRSYQPRERRTIRTTDSITGTSTSTPTTVASAAPD